MTTFFFIGVALFLLMALPGGGGSGHLGGGDPDVPLDNE
jgi:hypothetical protein